MLSMQRLNHEDCSLAPLLLIASFLIRIPKMTIFICADPLPLLTLSVNDAEIFLSRRNVRRNDDINLIYLFVY